MSNTLFATPSLFHDSPNSNEKRNQLIPLYYHVNLVGFLVQQMQSTVARLSQAGDTNIAYDKKSMCIENNGAKMEEIKAEYYSQSVFVLSKELGE